MEHNGIGDQGTGWVKTLLSSVFQRAITGRLLLFINNGAMKHSLCGAA